MPRIPNSRIAENLETLRAEIEQIKTTSALAAGNGMFMAQIVTSAIVLLVRQGSIPREAMVDAIDRGLLTFETHRATAPPTDQLAVDVARVRSESLLLILRALGA
jgi:hypothetical protein